ncbi:MAG: hypothetical protein WKF43_11335 [Acidimicrobiales bacterium]
MVEPAPSEHLVADALLGRVEAWLLEDVKHGCAGVEDGVSRPAGS